MAKKSQLRRLRSGTVINTTSKKQETHVIQALERVVERLQETYPVKLEHRADWKLKELVEGLRDAFPAVEFCYHFESSSIRPDGGILYLRSHDGRLFPILISEVKNQGTNDLRAEEGKPKQAKGNAIERLGKNVIGLRAALRMEHVFPFVCFGYGCDFETDSSILDRVSTIAIFGRLGQTYLMDEGPNGIFDRGSFYFRGPKWEVNEMYEVMLDIAERAILYYFSKYGKHSFLPKDSGSTAPGPR